jgi:hypothetical protein
LRLSLVPFEFVEDEKGNITREIEGVANAANRSFPLCKKRFSRKVDFFH